MTSYNLVVANAGYRILALRAWLPGAFTVIQDSKATTYRPGEVFMVAADTCIPKMGQEGAQIPCRECDSQRQCLPVSIASVPARGLRVGLRLLPHDPAGSWLSLFPLVLRQHALQRVRLVFWDVSPDERLRRHRSLSALASLQRFDLHAVGSHYKVHVDVTALSLDEVLGVFDLSPVSFAKGEGLRPGMRKAPGGKVPTPSRIRSRCRLQRPTQRFGCAFRSRCLEADLVHFCRQ